MLLEEGGGEEGGGERRADKGSTVSFREQMNGCEYMGDSERRSWKPGTRDLSI